MKPNAHPDIPDRFLPPDNYKSDAFYNEQSGHNIAYKALQIERAVANIVILPGLSEFGEKYIETARLLNQKNFDVYIIDWAYQGRSTRHIENPHKRHCGGYKKDVSDLTFLIENIIDNEQPIFFLGHSMGAHIGLRYLADNLKKISAASFSAPMLSPLAFRHTLWLYNFLLKFFPQSFLNSYVPGGRDWHYDSRKNDGTDIFSADPERDSIHNIWSDFDRALQVGNPTYGWIKETIHSIQKLQNSYEAIDTPILIGIAGKEKLVDNKQMEKAHKKLQNCKLLFLPNAKHEIMMEIDDIRSEFLNATIAHFMKSM